MKFAHAASLVVLCCLLDLGAATKLGAEGAKNRPVSKVITLLKDMKAQLEKEAEEDQEVYDKVACWCTTNDKEKSQAIIDAEARITDLTTQIEEFTAQSSRLNTEIKNLEEEIAKNQASLNTATALRQKQLAEFNSEEKEMLQCVTALKDAIIILSKHHGGSFVDEGSMISIAEMVRDQMHKHQDLLSEVITPRQRKVVSGFVQQPEEYFALLQQSYAPQSGEVFGILKQMKETFESNLSDSQKEELRNQEAYESLKAAKEEEIAAGQSAVETKQQELATTDEKNAQAKEDIEDTRNSLSADERFLMDLKQKCQMTDQEWEERQKSRQEEISACAEAISILASDDAHDQFTKTFNPSLYQASETSDSVRRNQAAKVLLAAGHKLRSAALVTLASKLQIDAFVRVKKAIDDMIEQLLKQKADEIKHKDFCVGGLNENEKQTTTTDRDKTSAETTITDLKMTIQTLTDEIGTLKAEITESRVQMKRAGEDREIENKDFQGTVADQRATQKLLHQALSVLKSVYAKKAALVQKTNKEEPAGPPPPPGFTAYKKSEAAGGIMGMIQQIINDAKAMEAEAIKAEEDAQKAYEDFVKETNNSIDEKSTGITNKSEDKAKAEGDLTAAEQKLGEINLSLEQLSNENSDLHSSCDFVLKNFDVRQEARDQEVEALRQAKAILSGAKFELFLQKKA